jgi:hypothetical protein
MFSRKRLIDYVFLLALTIYGLYIIRGMFQPGYFYNYDLNQHLVESYYTATVLIPRYHQLIGWNPYFYLGWPQGQFNPPASYLIYSILYYMLSWGLSPLVIFKIMLALFFLFQGYAIYFATRGFGLSRLSAFIAGFIAIGTAGGFETGGPVDALYYGMYEFTLAITLIPLTLAVFHQSFVRKSKQLLLLATFLVVFDFLLHTLAGVFLMVTLAIYTAAELIRSGVFEKNRIRNLSKTTFKFALVGLVVVGVCSFWLIPAYANRSFYSSQKSLVVELGNYATTYNELHIGYVFGEYSSSLITNILHPSIPQVTQMIWSNTQKILPAGSVTFYQLLLVLAIVGAAFSLIRSRSRFPILVIIALIGIFLFISLGPTYYESLWKDPTFHLVDLRPGRAAAVARVFLAVLGGAAIGEGFGLADKTLKKINKQTLRMGLKIGALMVVVFIGLTLLINSVSLMSQLPIGLTANNLTYGNQTNQVMVWVKNNVPNDTRVAYQEYPETPGLAQHLFAIAPLITGDQEVGSNYGFWWSGADASLSVNTILSNAYLYDAAEIYATLAGLNAGYVVVWSSNAKDTLSGWTGFAIKDTIGPFSIYELTNFTPSYATMSNGTGKVNVTSFQPEQIIVHVQNATSGSTVLVRTSYYSNWVASTSEGQQAQVKLDEVKLPLLNVNYTSIILPRNGTYNVILTYGQTTYDTISNAISAVSIFAFFVASVFVVLESKTRYPIAEYLTQVLKRTSEIARHADVRNMSLSHSKQESSGFPRDRGGGDHHEQS